MKLTVHHLIFTATAATPVGLAAQSGSAVRGAISTSLWDRFCANKTAPTCVGCALYDQCPVAALVAPMRSDEEKGSDQRPRPYVVRPPRDGRRRFLPGESFRFGLGLFGQAEELFPYIVMAVPRLEHNGLGLRLAELGHRRGTITIQSIEAYDPLRERRQLLYPLPGGSVNEPGLPIDAAAVRAYAAQLPTDQITLTFHTPVRLVDQQHLVKRITLRPLLQRLMRRLDDLCIAYGDGPLGINFRELLTIAEQVQTTVDQTRWIDVESFSTRQQRSTPLGGLIGSVTFSGPLAPLRELIVWGSLIHVGRNAVKGDGWYTVERMAVFP
ncbi:MAG: CRISPR system precrRNA processing endoribonuclease RAMP protein Cas6 [Chloroflexus sp.]